MNVKWRCLRSSMEDTSCELEDTGEVHGEDTNDTRDQDSMDVEKAQSR